MDASLYQAATHIAVQQPTETAQIAPVARLYRLAVSPGTPDQLARRMQAGLLLVASLLLASGLIFWIAANWQAQTRLFKLGLIEGALALCVLAALAWPRARLAALLGANLALGGLLAYIGQTYQTGADAWQLFATWAALSLVWTAAARSDLLWSLWVLIAAAGIILWTGRLDWWDVLWGHREDWQAAVLHMGLWLPLVAVPALVSLPRWLRLPTGMGWWSHRLALGLALMAWTVQGVIQVMNEWHHLSWGLLAPLLAYALVALGLGVSLRGRFQDFSSVCLCALASNTLVMALVARLAFAKNGGEISAFFLCSMAALACLGGTVVWLLAVQRRMRQHPAALQGGQP